MKTLNASEVKAIAKELKVKNWWNKKRQVLVEEIAALKGWENEKPEIIEYLLAGGEIKELPESPQPLPKNTREDSAGTKKKPRKVKKVKVTKEEQANLDEMGIVALQDMAAQHDLEEATEGMEEQELRDFLADQLDRKAAKKKAAKKPAKKSRKQEKSTEEGELVTLKDICIELKVEGRIARRKLRTSEIEKPEGQWAWTPGHPDIEKVKELLK